MKQQVEKNPLTEIELQPFGRVTPAPTYNLWLSGTKKKPLLFRIF
jgi:hypothetical protein